jgi:hypothetical protein
MSSNTAKSKDGKYQSVGPRGGNTYHGVRIPEPRGTSRFSDKELKRAVDSAIDKQRGTQTGRK